MATFTFTINGNTYTSDPANNTVPDGYRFIKYGYITALANLAADIVSVAGQVLGYKNAASDSADAAEQSALDAQGFRGQAYDYKSLAAQSVDDAAHQVDLAADQVILAAQQKALAADWATKTDDTVDGINYGAKYYAQLASSYVLPFGDAVPLMKNTADPTKQAKFNLSAIASGITRAYSLPNFDGGVSVLAKGADVASTASPNVWGNGSIMNMTGVANVTGLPDAPYAGAKCTLIAGGAFTLTDSANFIVKGGTKTVAIGDEIDVVAETVSKFRLTVRKADG
jgi:hypothetical protein